MPQHSLLFEQAPVVLGLNSATSLPPLALTLTLSPLSHTLQPHAGHDATNQLRKQQQPGHSSHFVCCSLYSGNSCNVIEIVGRSVQLIFEPVISYDLYYYTSRICSCCILNDFSRAYSYSKHWGFVVVLAYVTSGSGKPQASSRHTGSMVILYPYTALRHSIDSWLGHRETMILLALALVVGCASAVNELNLTTTSYSQCHPKTHCEGTATNGTGHELYNNLTALLVDAERCYSFCFNNVRARGRGEVRR